MGNYFAVNGTDFSYLVSGMKVGYEVLVSDESGRNANGDTVIDIVNRKRKLYVTLRHTTSDEMKKFLTVVNNFTVSVTYLDPKNGSRVSFASYTGTPEPEYYTISDKTIYKPMSLNFIEL
jgi:hypothetical protein